MLNQNLNLEDVKNLRKDYEQKAISFADGRYYSEDHPQNEYSKHIFESYQLGFLFLQWIPEKIIPGNFIPAHWRIEWVDRIETIGSDLIDFEM
jgi:hypothetical protein